MQDTLEPRETHKPYLTPQEVAAECGVTDDTVRRWINEGLTTRGVFRQLRARRVGAHFRIRPEWLREFDAAGNGGEVAELERDLRAAAERERQAEEDLRARLDRPKGRRKRP